MNTHTATDICYYCDAEITDGEIISWNGTDICTDCWSESQYTNPHAVVYICTCCERAVGYTTPDAVERGTYTNSAGQTIAWCDTCNTDSCSIMGSSICSLYQGPAFQCVECWEFERGEGIDLPHYGMVCKPCFRNLNV